MKKKFHCGFDHWQNSSTRNEYLEEKTLRPVHTDRPICFVSDIGYRKEMGIEPNAIFIGNWIWIGIGAVCHLPVCDIQPIYLSESERKSDGQCEQAVTFENLLSFKFRTDETSLVSKLNSRHRDFRSTWSTMPFSFLPTSIFAPTK